MQMLSHKVTLGIRNFVHLWPFSSLDNKLAPNKKSFGSFLDVGAAWLLSIQGWHADLVIYYKDIPLHWYRVNPSVLGPAASRV